MRLVIVESPYAGEVQRNTLYARACLLDCLDRGEAPIASHLLFPQVLDGTVPPERELGIAAGLAWRKVAELAAFYIDFGWSTGMKFAVEVYDKDGIAMNTRSLPPRVLQIVERSGYADIFGREGAFERIRKEYGW